MQDALSGVVRFTGRLVARSLYGPSAMGGDIASFRQVLREVRSKDEVAVADEVIAWALDHGLDAQYTAQAHGRKELRFRARDRRKSSVFSLHAKQGDLLVQERWLMHAAAFKGTPEGTELQDRLRRFVTEWYRDPSPDGFPNIYLRCLDDDDMRQALLGQLEWIVDRL